MATNYTVQTGDTLNGIANKFGYENYKKAGLTAKSGNPDLIRPGETFALNQAATSPAKDAYTASVAGGASSANAGAGSASSVGTGMSSTPTTPDSDPFSAYRGYLSKYQESLQDPTDLASARTSLSNISGNIDSTDLKARREYEGLLDAAGGTLSGAQQSATMARRRSNSELADLAIQQSGAARTVDALSNNQTAKQNYLKQQAELSKPMEIAGQYYDPTTGKVIPKAEVPQKNEPFELSPGQSRYTYNTKTGKYEMTASIAPTPKEASSASSEKAAETQTKRIETFQNDVSVAIQQLAQDKNQWGTIWNVLHARYPEASPELLDQMLMKNTYYPK